MGCTPSKGKLFSKPENTGTQKAPLADEPQDSTDLPVQESNCLETEQENENSLPTDKHPAEESPCSQMSSEAHNTKDTTDGKMTIVGREIVDDVVPADEIEKTEKMKVKKGKRKSSAKKRPSILRDKVDFSPHMVRAHQAVYAFLNPNISKYELLLGLLEQAAQTQLSLQPMMSALVLRFEEINQALEETVEEGELLLKEHGDYMALPYGIIDPAAKQFNCSSARSRHLHPPPDLLQQLLQHSTERMRLAGDSVQALGDTTLEEAIEYYSSVSKLLLEKLQAKQAVEQRLAQVLAQIEVSTIQKCNPEDSALHSEDSGIGGENESAAGSEQHRKHRGSAGSGSCGSEVNIHGPPNMVNYNNNDEDDEEDNDDEDKYGDDNGDVTFRKRSNSSPPDPCQALLYIHAHYMKGQQSTAKRPMTALTATEKEHPSFSKHLTMMMMLQNNCRGSDLAIKQNKNEIQACKVLDDPHYILNSTGRRRHSLTGILRAEKEPSRENQSPCCLPILAPHLSKRHSVRRLINTFSQGVEGRPGQSLNPSPPHIRRPRRIETRVPPDTVDGNQGHAVINDSINSNSWHDGRDDFDVDNLPPPPPEVLMDNSFQTTSGLQGNDGRSQENLARSLQIIQTRRVSQRLRSSVQNVEVLPSHARIKQNSISILPHRAARQDAVMGLKDGENPLKLDVDQEQAACLYQQACKIIHLRNAVQSHDKRNAVDLSGRGLSPIRTKTGQRYECNVFLEREAPSCNPPVTAPPVSRVRLPPSCPSVCHSFPNPSLLRPQIPSGPSSRPGSPREVTQTVDNIPREITPSVSFRDARSVFCVNEPQHISDNSVLPKLWKEPSQKQLPLRRISNFSSHSNSEQRHSLTLSSEFSKHVGSAPG